MRRTFTISFWDPEGQRVNLTRTFEDTPLATAREWAEDFGYAYSYKAECDVKEITDGNQQTQGQD